MKRYKVASLQEMLIKGQGTVTRSTLLNRVTETIGSECRDYLESTLPKGKEVFAAAEAYTYIKEYILQRTHPEVISLAQ